jgi:uncharacterized iron-regulated membrane protein
MDTRNGSRWFRFNLWLHRWTSLVATLPFLVLCLTGTVLIFHEEIDAAMGVVPTAEGLEAAPHRPLAESVNNILAVSPGERVLSLGIDPKDHPGVLLLVTAAATENTFDNAKLRFTRLADANPTDEHALDADKTLTGFLLELHAQWFLGPIGELVGALIALLVLLSLLSGLVVYAPYVKRVVFGVLRRGRGPRLLQLDLHNFIGAIVLGWALAVTITGFLLGFGSIATGLWAKTELAEVRRMSDARTVDRRHPPLDTDGAYRAALAAAPRGWHVNSIIFPGTDFSTDRHYTVLINGDGLDERLFRVALVDAVDGSVAAVKELPLYMKAIVFSQPLHFGDYGGLALKLLWTACTWLTLFITGNGAWLWWNRKRKRPRAVTSVGAQA